MFGKIEPRYGAEVYVGEDGDVCIKQWDGQADQVVVLHPDQASALISLIQTAIEQAKASA